MRRFRNLRLWRQCFLAVGLGGGGIERPKLFLFDFRVCLDGGVWPNGQKGRSITFRGNGQNFSPAVMRFGPSCTLFSHSQRPKDKTIRCQCSVVSARGAVGFSPFRATTSILRFSAKALREFRSKTNGQKNKMLFFEKPRHCEPVLLLTKSFGRSCSEWALMRGNTGTVDANGQRRQPRACFFGSSFGR